MKQSRPTRACELKLIDCTSHSASDQSRPTRACELKSQKSILYFSEPKVTPHAGV